MSDEIKILLDKQDDLAQKFWKLLQHFWDKRKGNNVPKVVSLWYNAGCVMEKISPHFNIVQTGPFIFRNKERIMNNDMSWIFDMNFEYQIEDWRKMITKVSPLLSNGLEKTLVQIKDFLQDRIRLMNNENDIELGSKLSKTLLSWYSRYSVLELEIIELKNAL